MDASVAKQLECPVDNISTQSITVADGNSIECKKVCRNFTWGMNEKEFTIEVMSTPLGSCDMVHGIHC